VTTSDVSRLSFDVGSLPLVVDGVSRWYWQDLPPSYENPSILGVIAPDAQLYYTCPTCTLGWRQNPSLLVDPALPALSCVCGSSPKLTPLNLRPRFKYLCLDCQRGFENFANPWDAKGQCASCQSRNSITVGVCAARERPPGLLASTVLHPDGRTGVHLWGADALADLEWLDAELRTVTSFPDAEAHLIPIVLFTAWLARQEGLDSAAVVPYRNFEATTLHHYYKLTGDVTAGWTAFRLFTEVLRSISDPSGQALVLHNICMSAYSFLHHQQPLVLTATDGGELLRTAGVTAGERAIELLRPLGERFRGQPEARSIPHQIARIHHVLGDILSIGYRADLLGKARRHYEKALQSPEIDARTRGLVAANLEMVRAVESGAGPSR
jgi:hypothetical protein